MSNRRRPRDQRSDRRQLFLGTDVADVLAVARRWRCPDCASESESQLTRDRDGVLHMTVRHDVGCPFLEGVTR